MTEASTGLRKALARGQKGTVLALSEMSADELLATLTDEQKAEMATKLSAAAPETTPAAAAKDMPPKKDGEDEEESSEMGDEPKSKKDDEEYMGDDAKAATERAVAVMSSEHAVGRNQLAADLLANDKLSADEIIKILSASAGATPKDPEDAAREEMKAALKDAKPSGIEANSAGSVPAAAAAGSIWDKSYAKLGLVKPAA